MNLRIVTARIAKKLLAASTSKLDLTFGTWNDLEESSDVVVVCHPEWRGVRAAAHAGGAPVIETADAAANAVAIVEGLLARKVPRLVVHGFPPGAEVLLATAKEADLWTGVVLHSSPTQHGGEPWEGAVADLVFDLSADGIVDRVGLVKAGVAESLFDIGYPTYHVPNRAPRLESVERMNLGPGVHIGVFAEPIFRKNLVPQILAASQIESAAVHVLTKPQVRYLDRVPVIEYSVLESQCFQRLLASVDINLQVTLSECHPMTPLESYLHGVPCLVSATSELFVDDPELAALTVVREHDNPAAIADAIRALLASRDRAVELARTWIAAADSRAISAWQAFLDVR